MNIINKKSQKTSPKNKKEVFVSYKIKELKNEDRPREKLLALGPNHLKTQELLALILNVGTKNEDVLTMSTRLLKEYGEKEIIYQKNPNSVAKDLNIPLTNACQIVACFELGRRFYQTKNNCPPIIRNSTQAFQYLKNMGTKQREELRGLYLNNHYQLIHDEIISLGTLTSTVVEPREVFRPAFEYAAAAVIIAHNHPSNILKPSAADLKITKKLKAAGQILNIELLDHIIIGQNKFFSII